MTLYSASTLYDALALYNAPVPRRERYVATHIHSFAASRLCGFAASAFHVAALALWRFPRPALAHKPARNAFLPADGETFDHPRVGVFRKHQLPNLWNHSFTGTTCRVWFVFPCPLEACSTLNWYNSQTWFVYHPFSAEEF